MFVASTIVAPPAASNTTADDNGPVRGGRASRPPCTTQPHGDAPSNCPALTANDAVVSALSTVQRAVVPPSPIAASSAKRYLRGSTPTSTVFVRHASPGADSSIS